jgi:hypothetical protein
VAGHIRSPDAHCARPYGYLTVVRPGGGRRQHADGKLAASLTGDTLAEWGGGGLQRHAGSDRTRLTGGHRRVALMH